MMLQNYLENSAIEKENKIALRINNKTITYGDLNKLSNKIANYLISNGIRPGTKIGLYLSKSINAIAAIFGILKAGAAYVPLDPDSPIDRIVYIISNCQIGLLFVDDIKLQKVFNNCKIFPEQFSLFSFSTENRKKPDGADLWNILSHQSIETQSDNNPEIDENDYNKDSLAFILYTSGSTGLPKGVMLTHANATAFVDWAGQTLNLNEDDVFSNHAPFHFDLSVFDIFVSFKVSGTLCLIPSGISYFSDALLDFIYKNKITVWYSVPSALKQLLKLEDQLNIKLSSIRILIYAGEVFHYKYLNSLKKYLANCEIYNFYGPTETNVITYYQLENLSSELIENVPIGKPCTYANIHIVDENNQMVKPGEIGELIVNGDSLMKGYWGDIKKTNSAIRKININNSNEEYFYYTGDFVFERPDGNIVYVSRKDNMVKTRGFRVELGEIESVLLKNKSINQAAIIASNDAEIGKRLYGFISFAEGELVSIDDLEDYCSKSLPAYMIPTKFFILDNFSLTSTGKVDRKKLEEVLNKENINYEAVSGR